MKEELGTTMDNKENQGQSRTLFCPDYLTDHLKKSDYVSKKCI